MTLTTERPDAVQQNTGITTVNGRRALLIGLGSAGAMICNQILERLNWTYESADYVTWVKCLILETQQVAADRAVYTRANLRHLKIDRTEYGGLISNPQLWRDSLDFKSWDISSLTGAADAITDGANNIRILGRLALLFPSNFDDVCSRIREQLGELSRLKQDERKVSQDFEKGYKSPVQVALSDELHVYVVGTLCGGTASGAFIDLGYLLKSLAGYELTTTGIFLLPSEAASNDLHVGNATAALVELNHYSDDSTRYSAQFPSQPGVPYRSLANGERPYRNLYLVQSRGPSTHEYYQLLTTSADYVYSDLIGASSLARDGARTNIAGFFLQRDYFGATQKYFTFGMSVIEFPYTKVLQGCSLKLARRGYQIVLGTNNLMDQAKDGYIARLPLLNRTKLIKYLLTRDGIPLVNQIDTALLNAQREGYTRDMPLDRAIRQINAAFGVDNPDPLPELPARVAPNTIEENARRVVSEINQSIRDVLTEFFVGADPRGITAAEDLLKALVEILGQARRAPSSSAAEIQQEMNAFLQDVRMCRNDAWLSAMYLKQQAVRIYVDKFIQSARDYYDRRLIDAASPAADQLLDDARAYIERILTRLTNDTAGLRAKVQKIIGQMDLLYQRTDVAFSAASDGWSRMINGVELFTPGQTIEHEYQSCLEETAIDRNLRGTRDAVENQLAVATTDEFFRDALKSSLFLPANRTGEFDPNQFSASTPLSDFSIIRLAHAARDPFEPLKRESIIDRLMQRGEEVDSILKKAVDTSEPFLNWSKSHPRYYSHENKSWGYVFYNDEHPKAAEFRERLRSAGAISDAPKEHREFKRISDRNQVIMMREQGAFSLGTISPLKDEPPTTHWWNIYNAGSASLHSRGDIVEWVTWARSEAQARGRARMYFLVGCALERIKFRAATQYEFSYDKTGPADPGVIVLPNDVDEAGRLINQRNLAGKIDFEVRKWQEDGESPQDVVQKLIDFVEKGENKFHEGDRRLTVLELQAYMLDFINDDTRLVEAYTGGFFPDTIAESYIKPDKNGDRAYFCPNCGEKLGFTARSLYVYSIEGGKQVSRRECALCRKSIP